MKYPIVIENTGTAYSGAVQTAHRPLCSGPWRIPAAPGLE